MAYFWRYDEFRFNNIDSSRYNLYIVSKDSRIDDRPIGLNSEMSVDENYKNPLFEGKKANRNKFNIEITKLNEYGNPYPITLEDYDNLLRWLEHDEPLPLEVNGLVYYGCFIEYSSWNAEKGIITLTFEMSERWAYSTIVRNSYIVDGIKEIKLYNKTNINKNAYMDITFELYSPTNKPLSNILKIHNIDTNKTFILKAISQGDKIRICGDTHEIYCINNESKEVFMNKEGDFIDLAYGLNRLVIEGTVRITIEYQYPIGHR